MRTHRQNDRINLVQRKDKSFRGSPLQLPFGQGGDPVKACNLPVENPRPSPAILGVLAFFFLGCLLASPTLGVSVEDLKEPIKDLKETIFGGWMWIPKIGAAVGGCLLAVYNQSIMPLATGAGVGLGIHFYDLYIKADGALI